jgi:hypothetical protein
MTPFSRQQRADDETLKAYLFGRLPQEETERLDELSVTDDEFAARLDTVENDLVDAYVRGELSGNSREDFLTLYLSTAKRREKVTFAESLYSLEGKHASHATADAVIPPQAKSSWWFDLFSLPRLALAGGLAMLLAISVLMVDNLHLRNGMSQAKMDREMLQQRERDLLARLDDERASGAKTAKELEQVRQSLASLESNAAAKPSAAAPLASPLSVAAFVLSPQLRGAGKMPDLSLPQGTTRVDLLLDLESDDFRRYRVMLKNPGSDRVLWRSGRLKSVTKGQGRTLSIGLPVNLLKPGVYQLEVTGTPVSGGVEFVSSYVFRIGSN